ncbi:MAG TPA: GNAT family N-acetyltransferase [Pyrinomonadaceae bacterium]|nr:GNAT family N-acetyltransferase [Pyrinomonadaceae bacterium]
MSALKSRTSVLSRCCRSQRNSSSITCRVNYVHNLSYYQRRLSTLEDVQIECAGDHNFAELFDAFVKLHEVRWRMNDMPGVLCDENMQSFHREAATGFLANGALRLYALRINRRIIAAFYGFHHAARTYYYLGGFDPEFKQYSPGNILIAHAITEAIREGAREFDFLRGQEDYKYRWRAIDRTIYRKRVTRSK